MARDFEVSQAAIDNYGQQHAAQNTENLTLPEGVAPFEAQYERVGQDLILSEHGTPVFTVTDYFLTATPADFVAANGAVLPGALAVRLSGSSLDAQYAQSGDVAASEPIGQVEAVSGLATVQHSDGSIEELTIGLKIYQNDILSTTINGKTSVTFSDGTIFSLAQSSRMVIDTLIFDPEGSENAGSFTLLTGGFVFIAGQVAKTGDMEVNTPTATLGIRGTTVQVDIQMVDGVATLNVTLNRDFDGAIGSILMTDLDGNLIATVTSTDKEWIISPVEGQTREVVRTASDMANDNELLADAFSAVQSAMLRVEAGETLVEQGGGEEATATPTPESVDPVQTPEVDGTGQGGDPLVPPTELPPVEGDNSDSPPPDTGPEKEASILDDRPAPLILPPTAADVEVAGVEDLPDGLPISGRVTATGGDTNAMSFSIETDPSNGTVAMNADGTFSYVPDADFAGTDVFTYTVIQGSGRTAVSDIGLITVSVSAVNDDPVAQDAVFTINEDSSVTGTLSAFDVDDDAIMFSVLEGQGPASGTVAMQPDGAFAYVPDGDFNGADSFTYTVTDHAGATDTATVSLTVSAVNDAPVVDALVANTTSEDDAAFVINMLAGASDVDAGETATLGVQNVTGLVDGVTLSGPTLTVDPADTAFQYLGVDDSEVIMVDYEVVDVQGAPVAQSATITITGSNDAPVVTSTAVDAADAVTESGKDENGAVVDAGDSDAGGTLTSSDVDTGATAAWSGTAAGTHGDFAINAAGTWTYALDNTDGDTDALAAGGIVADTFTATVTDDEGATATQLVTVTITGSNDAPVAVADTGTVDENAILTINVLANDTDVDLSNTHTVDAVTITSGVGMVAIVGNEVQWSPGTDYDYLAVGETATVVLAYDMSDNDSGTASSTVTITVSGSNDAPVTVSDTDAVSEDGTLVTNGSVFATDVDTNDTHTYALQGTGVGTYGIMIMDTDGDWSYNLANSTSAVQDLDNGDLMSETFLFEVDDGQGGMDTSTVVVEVAGEDDSSGVLGTTIDYIYLFPTIQSGYGGSSFEITSAVDLSGSHFTLDVRENGLFVDFYSSATWSTSSFNGFRLSDNNDVLSEIENVSLVNTNMLSLTDARITFDEDNIWVNWNSLKFNSDTFVDITIDFAEAGDIAGTAQNLTGTDGADLLLGSNLADTINGGAGADKIFGFTGNDSLNGGVGDDLISFSGSAAVGLDGGAGRDVLSLLFSGAVDLQSLNATSIEAVDLTNDTAQHLEMSLEDLNAIFDTGDIDLNTVLDANAPSLSYVPASTLTVLGDSSDSLTISGVNEGQEFQDTLIDVTATTGETLSIWQITTIGSNDVLATLGIDTDIAVNGAVVG